MFRSRHPEVVSGAKDFPGLLQGILNLASCEKSSSGGICELVFTIFVDQTKFVIIDRSGIECSDGTKGSQNYVSPSRTKVD
jgi:hypothetical protein